MMLGKRNELKSGDLESSLDSALTHGMTLGKSFSFSRFFDFSLVKLGVVLDNREFITDFS